MVDIIAQSLGLPEAPKEEKEIEIYQPEANVDNDFHESRDNIKDVLDTTTDAVKEAVELAQQSQHHLAYQALNALLKTKLDAARELLALQKERKIIAKMEQKDTAPQTVTNNNLFVGTTQDMLALVEKARNKDG